MRVVVPTGKKLLGGTFIRVTGREVEQLSVAVAAPSVASLMTSPQLLAPAPVPRLRLAGALMTGCLRSSTVTLAGQELDAPLPSGAGSVTRVVPIGYGPAGDCVTVIVSPLSGSNEPLSIEAS